MSSSQPRRRRTAALLIGIVLVLGLLSGCARQKIPTGYTDGVKEDFTTGCTVTAKRDGMSAGEAKDYCGCAWKAIKKDVPWSTFKKVNDDLTEDNGPLPSSITKVLTDCKVSG